MPKGCRRGGSWACVENMSLSHTAMRKPYVFRTPEGRPRTKSISHLLLRWSSATPAVSLYTPPLPAPAVLAAEIADDLEAALAQFTKIAARLALTK